MPKVFEAQTVVISCDSDLKACMPALGAGIPVVGAEFLLTGVLRQEVDVELYPLTDYFRYFCRNA